MGIFKAYDIRGIVPEDLSAEVTYKIGRAAPRVLDGASFIVGRDMRTTSPEIQEALLRGISDAGADAVDMGLCTTPMNYFAIGHGSYGGGAMVTASHNPARWCGMKFSRAEAAPVSYDTGYSEIERMVTSGGLPPKAASPGGRSAVDVWPDYLAHLLKFAEGIGPLKVAFDSGNGMTGRFVPLLFERLPCDWHGMYLELDGTFPNHEPNPLKPENVVDLQRKVVEIGADVGIAYDGDGDRAMFVDEKGARVSSDLLTALIAREVLEQEPGAAIIYDLRSSRVVPEEIERAGGRPVETRVGHSFMKRILRENGAPFGGELSGHYYFRDQYYSDTGELATVFVLRLLSRSGKRMSELIEPLKRYFATGEINFEVADKDAKIEEIARLFADGGQSRLDGITVRYEDWWFNVRKSNTEPILRLNLEADTPELRDKGRARVEEVIRG
jgi:phosphomannomutase